MSHWDKNYNRKQKYFNARYPVVAEIVEEAVYPKPEPVPENQEKEETHVEGKSSEVWRKGDIQRD